MLKGELQLDIIEGIKAKDESALRLLMEDYGDMLLRTAWLLLKDRQAAEEAVQDTFIQAYAKIGQLEDPQRLRAWLIAIAVNRCRMRQRTWSWRSIFPAAGSVIRADEESGGFAAAEELFMAHWENAQLGEAIRSLDYIYRECLTLYYYHEMSIREISAQLRMPENTVKSRLARGRALLKQLLEKEGMKGGQ
ncbi:RNA polymerase sigma factor [Paenibacillus tepidiphilus]|uniref:RNA polymerase sigma factor n=1 Tax=Paenibacillus tepidiphilus TaxID=2608683 RepID=UPI0023B04F19|nr:sigma-70 family RNA polymerase sigma factor [Paenibacillus tepidiphilus]